MIETNRTTIEPISLDDAPFMLELVNSPDWRRFIGGQLVANLQDSRALLRQRFLRNASQYGFGYFVARLKPQRVPIGICGFLRKEHLDHPDFGFALSPQYTGQGYALEVCSSVLAHGIEHHRFSILDAVTTYDNQRSQRLLEKLGFQRQATLNPSLDAEKLLLYQLQVSSGPRQTTEPCLPDY